MAKTEKRVVIDNNWYISFLIKKGDNRLTAVLFNYQLEIIISDDLLRELQKHNSTRTTQKIFFC